MAWHTDRFKRCGVGGVVLFRFDLGKQISHQLQFSSAGQAALARLQGGDHKVARIAVVFQTEDVAVFVQQDGGQIHLACGFAVRLCLPDGEVGGGQVVR